MLQDYTPTYACPGESVSGNHSWRLSVETPAMILLWAWAVYTMSGSTDTSANLTTINAWMERILMDQWDFKWMFVSLAHAHAHAHVNAHACTVLLNLVGACNNTVHFHIYPCTASHLERTRFSRFRWLVSRNTSSSSVPCCCYILPLASRADPRDYHLSTLAYHFEIILLR